jgi:hypothetical protein
MSKGFTLLREQVPAKLAEAVIRQIFLRIHYRGFTPDEIKEAHKTSHWLPELWANCNEINHCLAFIPQLFKTTYPSSPQLVIQFPDQDTTAELEFHEDVAEEGYRIINIVGVAITAQTIMNGALRVKQHDDPAAHVISLKPGDMFVMDGDLPHTSGYNYSAYPRVALYQRFLTPA